MKSLLPWFCLVAAAGSQAALAADGLDAYRQGNYAQAAKNLPALTEKDPVANYYLGLMRLYGYGQLKNNTMALRYFTRSAASGYLPAQRLLANYNLIEAKSPEDAFQWYKKAAEQNDVAAQMYCAAAYLYGYGVKENQDTARRYYIDAAKNGNDVAQYALAMDFLSSKDSRNKKMGEIWLTKAAMKGNPRAQKSLGDLYLSGSLVEKDVAKAKELFDSSAKQNYVPAMVSLGDLAHKGGDFEAAKVWLTKAADSNNAEAQMALAEFYLDDKNPLHDNPAAISWMTKAAQQGLEEAQLALSNLYKEGKSVAANETLSKQWADAATKSEEAKPKAKDAAKEVANWLSNGDNSNLDQGPYQLGGIYTAWHNPLALQENNYNQPPQMDVVTRKALYKPQFSMVNPNDVPINEFFDNLAPTLDAAQASKWTYPRYALDSQVTALLRDDSLVLRHDLNAPMVDINTTYPTENTVMPFDYLDEKSEGWLRQANYQAVLSRLYGQAILGVPEAQFELGQLYQYGIGVEKSPEQAITYYQLAAEQQEVRSEYNLGLIYLQGLTTPVDYQKGIDWMTDAAFKGDAFAQYVLANIYENGLKDQMGKVVVQPNHQEAMSMYYLASANHFGNAQYRLADYFVKEKNTGLSLIAKQNRNTLIKRLYEGAARQGVAEAVLPLAYYNAMDRDTAKQKQAFAVAKKEAQTGNPLAALLLGIMYERGIAVSPDQVEAVYWYQKAGNNPVSDFVLGTYLSQGKGLSKDMAKGLALLQHSADSGFSYGNLNLAILKHQQGEAFLTELDKARQEGNSKAGLLLADYYVLEANDPEKMKQGRDIYQYLAEKGDKEGQLKLAFMLERGLGGEASNALAAQWYTKAAEQGQPAAQYLLGHMYQLGKVDGTPNYVETKKWYEAAASHYPQAFVALGFVDETVDNNYASAEKYYSSAANMGDAMGQFNLGLIYEYGKGIPVDKQKAKSFFTLAAQQGHAKAMTQLGGLFFKGVDGKRDDQQALYWYKKAADLGENGALYQLGLYAETGVATRINYTDALNYYQKAADLGNDKAKLALARMYQYGIGVAKDNGHAIDIFKELAANNNAYAQYQLALIYLEGPVGSRQLQQGKMLLKQASENGNQKANNMLQWMDAQQEPRLSFIEPAIVDHPPIAVGSSPDLMYMDAMSEWNRGDETMSRLILNKLLRTFPDYGPAKHAYEQLNQQNQTETKTVG
jgi:enhanced entry protein EnhC